MCSPMLRMGPSRGSPGRSPATYGQDLGFSPVQVAMRAGHDPSVAAKHYTGRFDDTDRALSHAVASLLVPDA